MRTMKKGTKFTIKGHDENKKGELLVDGVNVRTNRKNKIVKQRVWEVGYDVTSSICVNHDTRVV